MQPPTAGRIVWYYNDKLVPTAAIVNQHADEHGRCSLTVFNPTGPMVCNAPECDTDDPKWGFWSWMPYQHKKAESAEGNESESAVEPEEEEEPDGEAEEEEMLTEGGGQEEGRQHDAGEGAPEVPTA
ncbi:MAG: hypothetical protein GY906_30160 [bacterium]|nr:hypothetical protein [bacterium]